MFTFKKIALVAASGLAAFAMSCSDDDGAEPDTTPVASATLTLSGGGSSFGDIDNPPQGYTSTTMSAASAASKIDIAVFPTRTESDLVYAAGERSELVSEVFLICSLSNEDIKEIKDAKIHGDLVSILEKFGSDDFDCDDDGTVPLGNDKAFMVWTSEGKWVAAVPSAVNKDANVGDGTSATFKLYYIMK